jgi:hypothetical protein
MCDEGAQSENQYNSASKTSRRMAYHAACWSVRVSWTQIVNVVAKNKTSGPQEINILHD